MTQLTPVKRHFTLPELSTGTLLTTTHTVENENRQTGW